MPTAARAPKSTAITIHTIAAGQDGGDDGQDANDEGGDEGEVSHDGVATRFSHVQTIGGRPRLHAYVR